MPSPSPRNTYRLVWQAPMTLQDHKEGLELLYCSLTGKEPTFFLQNLRSDYLLDSLLQHPCVDLTKEAEGCDSPVTGADPLAEACQLRQPHNVEIEMYTGKYGGKYTIIKAAFSWEVHVISAGSYQTSLCVTYHNVPSQKPRVCVRLACSQSRTASYWKCMVHQRRSGQWWLVNTYVYNMLISQKPQHRVKSSCRGLELTPESKNQWSIKDGY